MATAACPMCRAPHTHLGSVRPLAALRAAPGRLTRALRRVPRRLATRRPAPGEWAVGEVLSHLADAEIALAFRIRKVAAEPRQALVAWDQDRWAEGGRYRRTPVREALATFTALRRSNLDPLTRESLYFGLGKALDDCARYDEAFEQFALGNAASRPRLSRYDRVAVDAAVDRVIREFSPALMARATPVSEAPLVFITGMFRSGSTLFEQVLAAHPRVTAGGEIEYFMRFPFSFNPPDWQPVAEGYVDYLGRSFPGKELVTNKRPDAFALLGMLKASFPNARFVNTVRDPRDTAISIWFQQFDGRLGYAADLGDIAHHHRQYLRLMDHWRGIFGASIFDADYDAYVQDPRAVTERLLAFLGLDWHEGCLQFQKNATRVRTASVAQVREPIYRKSSGRWKNYERQLAALAPALGAH